MIVRAFGHLISSNRLNPEDISSSDFLTSETVSRVSISLSTVPTHGESLNRVVPRLNSFA